MWDSVGQFAEYGFDLHFPYESLKSALVVSLLSTSVLVGLFHYLNRFTRRRYFSIWTAAWMFYAVWLTLCIGDNGGYAGPFLSMAKQWCVGTAACFLIWGSMSFLEQKSPQRLFGFFMGFLLVWSYVGSYLLEDEFWTQLPLFTLMAFASELTAFSFLLVRRKRDYLGAGLLGFGFFAWGVYLGVFPFLSVAPHMVSALFFISAVLQLFIAVSMIVLVLEEVRYDNQTTLRELALNKSETALLKLRVDSTEARYRNLFEQASEGIVLVDEGDFTIIEANQTALRVLGIDPTRTERLLLSTFFSTGVDKDVPPAGQGRNWFEYLLRTHRLNLVRKDGACVPVEVGGSEVQINNKVTFQIFIKELTERARLEQQLRQAEKLSALGQMISGVAHELNNPLAVIKGYLELILARHQLAPQTRSDLEKVAHESNRAAKLVRNFLTFAREQPVRRIQINFNELIQRVVDLRQFDFRNGGIQAELRLDPGLPETLADPDQLQQVLMNLISNSIHAVADGGGGRIRISSSHDSALIEVRVEDSGKGVPAEVVGHLFEPFFTTKEVGTGTGLGLSIAHSILSEHQGRIYYERGSMGGACFVTELPIVQSVGHESSHDSDTQTLSNVNSREGSARILILDDEPAIAELLGEMLSLLGHTAVLANAPAKALQILEDQSFDLILSDFRMPEMNGQQFYEVVSSRFPEMASRFVFLTGDTVSEETQRFLKNSGALHIPKPFQLTTVEGAVNRILERGAEPTAAS